MNNRREAAAVGLEGVADDSALMAAVAHGDAQAFAVLMDRYLKKMVALAQRMLGNQADADDVAQEAFLRLWNHAGRWDPHGLATLRTWLSRVVINLCLDRCRKKRLVPLEEAGTLIEPGPSGFDSARMADRRRLVQAVLLELPPRQRAAVALAYFDELPGAEVAAAMQLSSGAVESLLVRARRTLRQRLLALGIGTGEDL